MTALTALRGHTARALRDVARPARALELARSGMIDLEYYEAQTGRRFASALQAARHYLGSPPASGLSLHPLFEAEYLETERPAGSEDAAVRYLKDPALFNKRSPHALFDLAAARRALGKGAGAGQGGSWLAWVRIARPDTPVPVPESHAPVTWGELRPFLLDCAVEWRESRGRSSSSGPGTRPSHGALSRWTATGGTDPVVSVVVRWDRPPELRTVLDAVLKQTYPHLEVLVVDDGSHADTPGVVAGVAAFDARVRLVSATGRGAAASLNSALRAATGDYLAFADSGLGWQPAFLADMVGTMVATEARFAYAPAGRSNGPSPAEEITTETLLQHDLLPLGSVLVAASQMARVGDFDESLPGSVGHDLLLRLSRLEAPRRVATETLVGNADTATLAPQPPGWRACVQARQILDWSMTADRPRDPGIVSVVVPILEDLHAAVGWARLVDGNDNLETVLVGLRSRAQYSVLRAVARQRRVVVLSSPADTWALLCNLGGVASTGERLVFVKAGTELDAQAVVAVARALDDPAVAVAQPINARIDLTVSSAGAYFAPGNVVPSAMLADHAMSDAERLAPAAIPAAYSSVVAVRAADFVGLAGFDPVFANSLAEVDLSLRAQALGVGRTELVLAQVTARSQQKAGFPHDLATSMQALVERWSAPPSGSAACLEAAGFAVVGHRARPLSGSRPS
ncbi:MAG TPA: glycosyltransferase family A protein, partial [Propionicimonas sp.]